MPYDDNAAEVKGVLASEFAQVIDASTYIKVRPRPSATGFSKSAVLDVPRRGSHLLQRVGHGSEVTERRIDGLEAAAVDEDCHWMRAWARGYAQLSVLTRIRSVSDAPVWGLTGKRLEFPWCHQASGTRRLANWRRRALRASSSSESEENQDHPPQLKNRQLHEVLREGDVSLAI
jgi:hypothetical protein